MAIVTLTIDTFTDAPVGAGQTFNDYKFVLFAADGVTVVQQGAGAGPAFTFPADVAVGEYVGSAQAEDTTGAAMGTALTAAVSVTAPVVTFKQPATMTVTLS